MWNHVIATHVYCHANDLFKKTGRTKSSWMMRIWVFTALFLTALGLAQGIDSRLKVIPDMYIVVLNVSCNHGDKGISMHPCIQSCRQDQDLKNYFKAILTQLPEKASSQSCTIHIVPFRFPGVQHSDYCENVVLIMPIWMITNLPVLICFRIPQVRLGLG